MAISLILIIDTERPPDIGARRWSDFTRAGMDEVAKLWHSKYIKLHFQDFSAVKYGYQPRLSKTLKRKRKLARIGKVQKGGRVPLVWTGLLERQMLRRGILRVFPRRFTLRKPAGPYITNRPRGRRPNMVKEITTVIPSEERGMASAFESKAAELMNTFRAHRHVKI